MQWLLNLLGGSALGGVNSIIKTVAGDATQRESDKHDEEKAVLDEATAEATAQGAMGAGRTWFDSLVDGINRLCRPTFTFGTIALFVMAVISPLAFSAAMTALQLVPTWLAGLMATIVGFWFGGRLLSDLNFGAAADPAKVQQVLNHLADIKSMQAGAQRQAQLEAPTPAMPAKKFEAAMADTATPLSDDAILEWNRRRQSSGSGNGSAPR